MKGAITNYIDEKGYGFIKDENGESRFFHISKVKDNAKFLGNIIAYYYSDFEDRDCFIVNFTPSTGPKGPTAIDIKLSNSLLNDKSNKQPFNGLVEDLKYDTASLTRISTGIKGGTTPFGATAGSNGTFRMGYPEVLRELNIYYRRLGDLGWGTIDVRELALQANTRQNVTDKFVEALKKKICGKQIEIVSNGSEWELVDTSILVL
jgi:cold shock CspA family protein